MPDGNQTLIIVPTFNERENLPSIVKALDGLSVDMLVVDDNPRTARATWPMNSRNNTNF